jgi:hypothetical protein
LCSEAQVDILSHTDDGGVDDVKAGMLFTGCVEIGADMMKGKQKQREQKAQDYSTKRIGRMARWTEVVESLMKTSSSVQEKDSRKLGDPLSSL